MKFVDLSSDMNLNDGDEADEADVLLSTAEKVHIEVFAH